MALYYQLYRSGTLEALSSKVKAKATMKGDIEIYRLCDDVWTLIVKNSSLKCDHETIAITDKVKIVAGSHGRAGE
ncbi:Transcription initiation factor IIA subunit 2 [Coemansia sp. S146]|nr:Transcription initiation factor IIA subunit 2 [Coemansia sp. S146]